MAAVEGFTSYWVGRLGLMLDPGTLFKADGVWYSYDRYQERAGGGYELVGRDANETETVIQVADVECVGDDGD